MRRSFVGIVAVLAVASVSANAQSRSGVIIPDAVDIVAGEDLYAENCASCHGANLEGQENWQTPGEDGRVPAPPHDQTGHTWHHADQVIFEYTKLGGQAVMAQKGMAFDSGMPGFGKQLSDQDIWNILGFVKSTWPQRIRETQAIRTEGETKRRGN